MNPLVISGAYGTLDRHQEVDPLNIGDERVRSVHDASYRAYAQQAGIVVTNTFRTRNVLRRQETDRFQNIIAEHVRLLREILRPDQKLAVSFGPWGDCYKPEEAASFAEAADFWETAFSILLSIRDRVDIALTETINTSTEAAAIAEAWGRVQKDNRAGTQLITSIIPKSGGKLYSGEDLSQLPLAIRSRAGRVPLLGLNCFPINDLAPALEALSGKARVGLVYPNAADGDPKYHEGSKSIASRSGHEAARLLSSVIRQFRETHPNIITGECCGTDFKRIEDISKSRLEETTPVA